MDEAKGKGKNGWKWLPSWKATRGALGWLYGVYVFVYLILYFGATATYWHYTVAPALLFVGYRLVHLWSDHQELKPKLHKLKQDLADKEAEYKRELNRVHGFLVSRGLEEEYWKEGLPPKDAPDPYENLFG